MGALAEVPDHAADRVRKTVTLATNARDGKPTVEIICALATGGIWCSNLLGGVWRTVAVAVPSWLWIPISFLRQTFKRRRASPSCCWPMRAELWKKIQYPSPCGQLVDSKVVPAGGRTMMTMMTDRSGITMRQAAQELLECTETTLLRIYGGAVKSSALDTAELIGFRSALLWVLSYRS